MTYDCATMKQFFLITLFLLISHSAFSQLLIGNSASFLSGFGDHGDMYDNGFGLGVNADLKIMGQLGLTGEFAWNRWSPSSNSSNLSDINTYNLLAGGKIGLSFLYLELRMGYYFGDIEEFAVIPAAGLRLGKLDLNAGYQLSSDFNFFNFRLAYFWTGIGN